MPNAASLQTSCYNLQCSRYYLLTDPGRHEGGWTMRAISGVRIFARCRRPATAAVLRQMLRSVLTLAACLATTAATAPRPALLQLRGGGGVVEEQPKTGKLWVARSVESSPAPMAGAGPSG